MSDLARLQALFERVVDLPVGERAAVLDELCADDADLRARVEALLASDEALAGFTARKAVGQVDALLLGASPDALIGAQVGRYTLLRLLGAGGGLLRALRSGASGAGRRQPPPPMPVPQRYRCGDRRALRPGMSRPRGP